MPNIHRRTRDQISQDHLCLVNGCDKRYGSYPALYTHMKNKHPQCRRPEMNQTKNHRAASNVRRGGGRPKQRPEQIVEVAEEKKQCRICNAEECECLDTVSDSQIDQVIRVMSEDHYIKLTNAIGGLTKGETPLFVRNTEMEYEYLNKRQVQDIMDRNMTVYGIVGRVNEKLLEYLSFSSKYWNPELLRELYDGIYVILAHRNIEGCLETYNTNRQKFQSLLECIKEKREPFQLLYRVIKTV